MDAKGWATDKWGGPDPKSYPDTKRMDALWGDHDPKSLLKEDPPKAFRVGVREIEVGTSTILRINSMSSQILADDALITEAKTFEKLGPDSTKLCAKWNDAVVALKEREDGRSPSTAAALENLARVQRCAGRYEEALDTQEESVNMYDSMMHVWAQELLRARCWFADILMCHGEVEDGRFTFSRVLVEWETSFWEAVGLFGPDQLGTLNNQYHYAMALLDCGHYDGKPTEHTEEALKRLEKYPEKEKSQVYWEIYFNVLCIRGCAYALDAHKDDAAAAKTLSIGITQLELLTGPNDYILHRSKVTLMGVLVRLGEIQKARILGAELMEWSRNWYGDLNPDTLADVSASVRLHFENLRYYRYAASLQKFFIDMCKRKWGEDDVRVLKGMETLRFMLPICGIEELEIEPIKSNAENAYMAKPAKSVKRKLRKPTMMGPAGKVRFIASRPYEEALPAWDQEEQDAPPKDITGFQFSQYTFRPPQPGAEPSPATGPAPVHTPASAPAPARLPQTQMVAPAAQSPPVPAPQAQGIQAQRTQAQGPPSPAQHQQQQHQKQQMHIPPPVSAYNNQSNVPFNADAVGRPTPQYGSYQGPSTATQNTAYVPPQGAGPPNQQQQPQQPDDKKGKKVSRFFGKLVHG